MVYRNQNYMTNMALKEQADQAQKDYIELKTITLDVACIDSEESYNTQLQNKNSILNKYYAKYPREDGIDSEGNPVRDPNTEIVGHSWESAITAPTDPAETSSYPWILLDLSGLNGTIEFKYDGEVKLTKEVSNKSFMILSVPNSLKLTDYRLEWGTGKRPANSFNVNKLEAVFTKSEE